MTVLRKKIVMLGGTAVGKTSLVQRFVTGLFSEKYLTTVGVKIDKKDVEIDDHAVSMILWDLHGDDEYQRIQSTFLRGSAGYLLVVDGTRRQTLDKAVELHAKARATIGEVPFTLLINKADLRSEWEVTAEDIERLRSDDWLILETSALAGSRVDEAFEGLARRMVDA